MRNHYQQRKNKSQKIKVIAATLLFYGAVYF